LGPKANAKAHSLSDDPRRPDREQTRENTVRRQLIIDIRAQNRDHYSRLKNEPEPHHVDNLAARFSQAYAVALDYHAPSLQRLCYRIDGASQATHRFMPDDSMRLMVAGSPNQLAFVEDRPVLAVGIDPGGTAGPGAW
jgi:hypothetical protein